MAPPSSALNPVTRTPVLGLVTPGVYTGSVPPLPSTKPRVATVPPETVMKLLALLATPLLVAKVVLRPSPPVATLLNRRLEKAATVDCSVPSETSLSLLSSPVTATPEFCNPDDSSRVTDPLMLITAGTQRSSSASSRGRKPALRPAASGARRRERNRLKNRDVNRWRMEAMFIVLSCPLDARESEPNTKGPLIRERPV